MTSQGFAKRALGAHTWLGLVASALMYAICLSGTVAVFHHELERWEQPQVEETETFSIAQLERAYQTFDQRYPEATDHMHLVFPSSGIPRVVMENDHVAHFVDTDGQLGDVESAPWTKMLVDLHLYLHLPKSFGMILVSAFGAVLCALLVSGLLAHPRIVKDAFRLRLGGSGMQQNIDLHNRFSVWAAPFHLMIGVTGAYFGLAGILIVMMASAFYGGDRQAVVDQVFTPEPELTQTLETPAIGKAIRYVQQHDPEGQLIFLTVHEPRTEGQFIEIYVKQPQRLIYSENYRFDVQGNFIGRGGYRDGEAGKQVIYSFYRLHFGDFGGIPSKVLYFVLGMMLTVVSATGINIWLAKRKTRDIINRLWPAFVWLLPTCLSLTAGLALIIKEVPTWWLWTSTAAGTLLLALRMSEQQLQPVLKRLLGGSLMLLLTTYVIVFGGASLSLAALQINLPLLGFALYLCFFDKPKLLQTDQTEKMRNSIVANNSHLQ